jgi:hypothetical protein
VTAPVRQLDGFDPRGILETLSRHRVSFVLIGALARVLQGTDEVTGGVDICPQRKAENLERLDNALAELGAEPVSGLISPERAEPATGVEAVLRRDTMLGLVLVVPEPEGSRAGWGDLRRRANREALGQGLRVDVASLEDLQRMSAALNRDSEVEVRKQLRRLEEIERGRDLGRGISR